MQEPTMPDFTVELSFEYKSTYRVTADTAEQALAAAEAHDGVRHGGPRAHIPEGLAHVQVEIQGDREFSDDLDSRVFDEGGNEID
jgi:hypothetical protein